MRLSDVNWWYVLAAISGSVTVIAALGEWVFRWWDQPGDAVSVLGLFVTLLALGFGASGGQVRRLTALQERTLALQERSLALQEREFRALRDGQERQTRAQEGTVHELRALREGQERQTRALEEAVAFFRSTRT